VFCGGLLTYRNIQRSGNCLLSFPSLITSPAGADAKYCDEYVCLCESVCPRGYPHTRSLPIFLRMLPMSVARSSSGTLTIGRIAYRREGGDGSAQRGRSVIYYCLVIAVFHAISNYIQYVNFHCTAYIARNECVTRYCCDDVSAPLLPSVL